MSEGIWPEIIRGDCRALLPSLPSDSVHCCITSPPYWGLRDYGTATWEGGDSGCDHRSPTMREGRNEDRAMLAGSAATNSAQLLLAARSLCGKCGARRVDQQIGLEPTVEAHIEALLEVFREVRRVLRKDGTLWLNYGDCYAGAPNGRSAADVKAIGRDDRTFRDKPFSTVTAKGSEGPVSPINLKSKDLVMMPYRLAIALQADGWYVRSAITIVKNNPMPESVTDRPTSATEMLFMLTKAPRYFYDADAIRERQPTADPDHPSYRPCVVNGTGSPNQGGRKNGNRLNEFGVNAGVPRKYLDERGRNKRNWWLINSQPMKDAHYAAFSEKLVEPCILAGTSERGVCPDCGAPWERVTEKEREYDHTTRKAGKSKEGPDAMQTGNGSGTHDVRHGVRTHTTTTGWRPTCSHPHTEDELLPAVVLDCFAGSGTVSRVASRLGRRSIGIELSEEYVNKIARKRNSQGGLGL